MGTLFRGGGTVNARIVTSQLDGALMVPEQSVVLRPAGKVVYALESDVARQRVVETGMRQDGLQQIVKGLDRGRDRGGRRRRLPHRRRRGHGARAARRGQGHRGEGEEREEPPPAAEVMTLSELSIRRHVFAFMLSAVLVLFGAIAYLRMGVDKLPYIEFPVISINTQYKGANPDIIDASITNLIETAVNSVPGIEHIASTSTPGTSLVVITFSLEKRIDVAFQEVQAKVNQVVRRLPKDADPPVVAKVETNTQAILQMAIQGDRTQQQLNLYAINVIKKQLETIDGVGEVRIGGRRDRNIRVNLVPAKLAAYGVAAQDITNAFGREHIQLAGGFLVGRSTEHLVKIDLEFHKLEDLAAMIVGYKDGSPVRLRDIAEIEDGLTDNRQLARLNGRPAVGVGIVKVPNTNTVEIIDRVLERVEKRRAPAAAARASSCTSCRATRSSSARWSRR